MSVLAIVPTLGTRIESLESTLDSIRDQAAASIDIVIVTPKDTDESLLRTAASYDARIRPDPGVGLAAALNRGLEAANDHEFFMWLNDDDVLTPGAVEASLQALGDRADAVMVYGNIEYVDPGGSHLAMSSLGAPAQWLMTFGPNLVPQPGSIARLSAVTEAGGLDESLSFALDQDLFLRLRRIGPIIHIDHTVARYTWHPDALTVKNRQPSIREAEQVRRRYRRSKAGNIAMYPFDVATRLVVRFGSRRLTRRARTEPTR